MANSPNLALPYLEAAQAQKHVTVNESLRLLDALVQLAVESAALATPPGSPANGDAYIVAASPTGAWSGWAGSIAFYADTAWQRLVPAEGWLTWNKATDTALVWTGAAWVNLGAGLAGADLSPGMVTLGGQASDPGSPAEGQVWRNSTTGQIKARIGSRTRLVVDAEVPWLVPVSGDHVMTTCGSSQAATGTGAGAADRMDIYPFIPRSDLVIDQAAVNVTTGVASAQGKVVIYSADANGRPDALLLETGNLDLSAAAVASVAASITLREGITYWIGLRHSSTATLSTWALGGTPDINGGAPATTTRKLLRRSLAYATAAPSSWGFTSSEITGGAAPAIWLRVA